MLNQEDNPNNSIFAKAPKPILIAGLTFGGSVALMLLGKIIEWLQIADLGERFAWVAAGSFLLLYAVYNSVFSLNSPNLNRYWRDSILVYALLMLALMLAAYLFSNLWITEAGSFLWIFFILTFGYLTFLSIMGFVKGVFGIVKREDERMHGKWD